MTVSLRRNYSSFMRMKVCDYTNSWIAVVDGKVIANGKTFKDTYLKSKEIAPNKRPLIAKIPDKKVMIL